ncbi:MAG: ABC transporter permease [Myxococcales bacterium]|nr:ABC transporter permease [Myxococcales bacterium]
MSEGSGEGEQPEVTPPVESEEPAGAVAAAVEAKIAGEEAAKAAPKAEAKPKSEKGEASKPVTPGWFSLRADLPTWGHVVLGGGLVAVILAIWIAVTTGEPEMRTVPPTILPHPSEVLASFSSLLNERGLITSIFATLRRVFLGFGLAIVVGVPLGMAAGAWRPLGAALAPLIMFGRNIPIAALVPLTMVWFGLEEGQKVMFIFMATFPFIFSDAVAEIGGIHERYVETGQTLGASPLQIFRKILVPLALPNIYTKLRHMFGLAFGYIMLAELINTDSGLGFLLRMSQRRGQTEHIFLILFVITALAVLIDRALAWFQRGIFPYRKDL